MTAYRSSNHPVAWVLGERGVQIILAMSVSAFIARVYGPENFGTLQTYLMLASAWASVGLICSAEVLMPRYASGHAIYASIFTLAFMIRSAAAVIAAVGYSISVTFKFNDNIALGLPFLAIVLLTEPFAAFGAYFQTQGLQKIWSRVRIIGLAVKSVLIGGFCFFEVAFFWIAIPYAIEAVLVALLISKAYFASKRKFQFSLSKSILKEILGHGLVMGIGLCSMVLLQKLDRLHLGALGQFEIQGYYSAGMQITENWLFCASILIHAIAGRYIYSQTLPLQKNRILKMVLTFLSVATLGWIIGSALAPYIVRILYGAQFALTVPFLRWQLFFGIFFWMDAALSMSMFANKATLALVGKWLIALGVAFVVHRSGLEITGIPDPVQIPLIGYSFALIYSLFYFLRWYRKADR